MSEVPDNYGYTKEHVWALRQGPRLRIGITDYAQDSLGDLVAIDLPNVGDKVVEGEPLGELESTKSISDVFSPVTGTVATVNEALDANPELVNEDPYCHGWLVELHVEVPSTILLTATAYKKLVSA